MCTDIFEHVFSEELGKERTHDFSARKRDLKAEITHILYHLQDSRSYIRGILSCESGEMFMRFFKVRRRNRSCDGGLILLRPLNIAIPVCLNDDLLCCHQSSMDV